VKLAALALIAIAAPAAADPCDVRVEHAPDAVRSEVARWLLDEHQCGPALEVRIVPTTEGLYVFARDANGRVRERTVPDAQNAGVLIASWAAADADTAKPAMAVEMSYVPAKSLGVDKLSYAPAPASIEVDAPGIVRDGGVAQSFAPRRRVRGKTVGIQLFGNGDMFGLRSEVDVWRRGPWVAATVASFAHDGHIDWENRGYDDLDYYDLKALASVALRAENGPWRVQWSGAAGVLGTYVKGDSFMYAEQESAGHLSALGVSPTVEAAVTFGYRIAPQWHLEAGPLATLLVQRYYETLRMGYTEIEPRWLQLTVLAGLRYSR
jgi:hypothetical protein